MTPAKTSAVYSPKLSPAVIVALDKSLDRPTYNPDTEGLVPVAVVVGCPPAVSYTAVQKVPEKLGPAPRTIMTWTLGS